MMVAMTTEISQSQPFSIRQRLCHMVLLMCVLSKLNHYWRGRYHAKISLLHMYTTLN